MDTQQYIATLPGCLLQALIRTLLLTSVFGGINFFDKYLFGASFVDSASNTLDFVIKVTPALYLLIFLTTFVIQIQSNKFIK